MPHNPNDITGNEDFNGSESADLIELLGTITSEDFERFEPPPTLWPSIVQRLEVDPFLDDPARPQVTDLADRRSAKATSHKKRAPLLMAAAAAAAVVLIGAAVLLQNRNDPSDELIASATLEQLEPLGSLSASATLIVDSDGKERIVIDAVDMPEAPEGESYELWLIDAEVTEPLSLGVVTGSGEIEVPPSIDPATHPVVDISLEPNDGDPAHSGHSLMRGTLA